MAKGSQNTDTASTNTPSAISESATEKPQRVNTKKTLGWLQSIRVLPYQKRMTAKLDTGAKSNVMHAVDLEPFTKNKQQFIRFKVPLKNADTEILFELPVVKQLKIKRHDFAKPDQRPVVEFSFCIDGVIYTDLFSLDDRSKFNYPVLLGRNFITGKFVIDSELKFNKPYHCP